MSVVNTMKAKSMAVNKKGLIGVINHNLYYDIDNHVLLKTLEIGICGTDRDLALGNLNAMRLPPNQDYLIIGHECKAEVMKLPKDYEGPLKEGDIVVSMVRRGCGKCKLCKIGMPEYCESGEFKELGIIEVNGCMAEYYVDEPQYLIKVPEGVVDYAVLAEPLSGIEKAIRDAIYYQSRIPYNCEDGSFKCRNVLVIGTGPIGLLTAAVFKMEGFDNVYISNIRELRDKERIIINSLNVKYYNAIHGYDELYKEIGGFDIVFDTTGKPSVVMNILNYMKYNGTVILYGFPRTDEVGIFKPALMTDIVYKNISLLGSVTGPMWGFKKALNHLSILKTNYPTVLNNIITNIITIDEAIEYLKVKHPGEIKTIIKFER